MPRPENDVGGRSRPPGDVVCPFEGVRRGLAAAATSPSRWPPLMGLAALQSVVCSQVPGPSGYPVPPRRRRFRPALAVFLRPPSPQLARGFILSCASPPLQSLSSPARPTPRRRTAFLGVPLPFATSASGVRFSPGVPPPDHLPPSTFRTSSTACSAAGLAGLFHPAATSGIRSPGVFPAAQPTGSSPALALVSFAPSSCLGCPRRRTPTPAFRALLRAPIRRRPWGVSPRPTRSPPELLLPRVLLRTPRERACDPSSPPSTAFRGPRRLDRVQPDVLSRTRLPRSRFPTCRPHRRSDASCEARRLFHRAIRFDRRRQTPLARVVPTSARRQGRDFLQPQPPAKCRFSSHSCG